MRKIKSTVTTLVTPPEFTPTETVSPQTLNEKLSDFNTELNETLTAKLTAQQTALDKANQTISSLQDEVDTCKAWLQHLFDYYATHKTLDPVIQVYRQRYENLTHNPFRHRHCYRAYLCFVSPKGCYSAIPLNYDTLFYKPRVKVVRWGTNYITVKLNGKEMVYDYEGERIN